MVRKRANGERGIASAIVTPVLAALAAAGFDAARFARSTGDQSAGVVAGPTADRLFDAAAEQLGDDAVGLTVARKIPIGALGPLDYALCTSAVLREGLGRLARHYAIVTHRVRLALVEEPPRAALVLHRQPDLAHSRHWVEFSLAVISERMRQTLGTAVVFDEVAFAHPGPANARRHEELFGVPVLFSQPRDRMSFASALLDQPLLTAAKYLSVVLDDKMDEIEKGSLDADPLLDRVRRTILALLDDGTTELDQVAKRLHLSRRTLQRELKARGTAHKDLLDEIRRERALHLLGEDRHSIGEAADLLGFSDHRAFFRAFHRWTGMSPKAFRDAGRSWTENYKRSKLCNGAAIAGAAQTRFHQGESDHEMQSRDARVRSFHPDRGSAAGTGCGAGRPFLARARLLHSGTDPGLRSRGIFGRGARRHGRNPHGGDDSRRAHHQGHRGRIPQGRALRARLSHRRRRWALDLRGHPGSRA